MFFTILVNNQFSYNFADNPQYNIEFPRVQYCGGPLYYLNRKALDVFKNGISTGLIVICGLAVDSTNQELIPKEESNVKINLFLRFGS